MRTNVSVRADPDILPQQNEWALDSRYIRLILNGKLHRDGAAIGNFIDPT